MDIGGDDSKIATCSGNADPCTASLGNVCSAASAPLGGVVCSLPACPTIVEGNWDLVWSESCKMGTSFINVYSGKTVKIKKNASMVGELVIHRGSDTSDHNRHFYVQGTLELEDVTLKGGHAVSSFVSLYCCEIFIL